MSGTILVRGSGGFFGHHLVTRLKAEGNRVVAVDLAAPRYAPSDADVFVQGDLRDRGFVERVCGQPFDEIYQLAADRGARDMCSPA